MVFGLERFHYFAYGRPILIETDHKPLESIHKKHLKNAPPRLARMLLRIQKYDVTIKYVHGKDLGLADAPSHVHLYPDDTIKELDIHVREMCLHFNASPTRIEQIREETAKGVVPTDLQELISKGWPERRSKPTKSP